MAKMNIGAMIANKTKETFANNKLINNEIVKNNILIVDELRDFIPPLGVDEYAQLEANIIKNGCRDALSIWETTQSILSPTAPNPDEPIYVLIDGHNRYDICKRNNIAFGVQLLAFSSLQDVKDYMIDLQLGRRNLTPEQVSYFRGLRFLNERSEKGKYDREKHKVQNEPYGQNEVSNTADRLADEYNVGRSTIKRDAEFAKGINKLEKNFRDDVLSGKQKVSKTLIQSLAKLVDFSEPIKTLEELEKILTPPTPTSVNINEILPTQKSKEIAEFDNDYATLLKTVKKLYKSKDKLHLVELQTIISKMESYI